MRPLGMLIFAVMLAGLAGCVEFTTRSDGIAPSAGWAQVANDDLQAR